MRPALTIAAHHLRRMVRNPGLVLVMLAIPLTLAVIEYAAFGRTVAAGKLPPTTVLFLDEDDTLLSGAVPQVFSGGPAKDFFELAQVADKEEAVRRFKRGQASALVVVPGGFQQALLGGRRAEIGFYPNPIHTIGPEMARSLLEMTIVIGNGLYAQAIAPIAQVRAIIDESREPTADEVAAISRGFFEAGQRLAGLQGLANLTVGVRRPGEGKARTGFGSDPSQFFAYVFPGLALFGLLFIAQSLAIRLMRDRLRGLQRRLVVTPAGSWQVVLGGVLFLVTALGFLLAFLGLIGAAVFGIRLRDPLALVALGTGFAVFAAGLHLLSTSLARSDRSAGFVGSVVVLVLSLVGGTFLPSEQYPPLLRSLATMVPNGAAQQGLIDVLVHRIPLAGLGGRLAVTWAWGLAALGLAVMFERRRLRS